MDSDRRGFFKRLLGIGALIAAPKVLDIPAACPAPAYVLPCPTVTTTIYPWYYTYHLPSGGANLWVYPTANTTANNVIQTIGYYEVR